MRRRTAGSLTTGLLLLSGCGVRLVSPQERATGGSGSNDASALPEPPRIDVETAFAEVRAGRAVLVDVRSRESHRARRAAGAISLPLEQIELAPAAAIGALPAGKLPILYCT
jgi:hypothetical protein